MGSFWEKEDLPSPSSRERCSAFIKTLCFIMMAVEELSKLHIYMI